MKNILKTCIVLILFLTIGIVNARENRLYFTNNGDRLYYDSSKYDDEYFMKHIDMVPGSSFEDKLTIENGSMYDYKLYFRVKNREQSELAKELLENVEMQIYLDGKLLYDGYANGFDYSHDGLDLTNTIYIGEYEANSSGEIVAKTKLSNEYSNTENDEFSYVEWEFIAEYNDLVLPINPDTSKDNKSQYIKILLLGLSLLLILFIIIETLFERKKQRV